MSKQDNLTDFLTDVADAIREKKGSSEKINPQNFSEEIKNLPSGGEVNTFGETMVDNTGAGVTQVKSLKISSSITNIANYAYQYLQVSKFDLHDGILSIGDYAFRGCSNLVNIMLPPLVTIIPNYFLAQTGVTNFEIHGSVTEIGSAAFYSSKVKSITIPSSVKKIGAWCFEACSLLESVRIGSGITFIDRGAFVRCAKLSDIYIDAIIPPAIQSDFLDTGTVTLVHVPEESFDAYKNATNWTKYANNIVPQ